ncbi:YggT family protein [Candidatus Roizmanbacteria bacterium]|nr:YggT family protein [Candidatus Roizmanbacteria bacterium]
MITAGLILTMLNLLVIIAEGVISLRIILKLMGASEIAPFVRWIYETSKPLLYPFQGMFPSSSLRGVPFTIEFSAIFAIFFYMFAGYIIQEIIDFVNINLSKSRKNYKRDLRRSDGNQDEYI